MEDKPDTEDVLSVYGLSLDMDTGLGGLGVDYVTDLSESMGVLQTLQDSTLTPLDEHPGISVNGYLNLGPAGFIAEAVHFLDDFDPTILSWDSDGAQPSAYHVEAFYGMTLSERPWVFSAAMGGPREALALGLPEQRLSAAAICTVSDGFESGLEYLVATDYDEADGGTGADSQVFSFLIRASF